MDATKLLQAALNDAGVVADVKSAACEYIGDRGVMRYEYVQENGVLFHDVAVKYNCPADAGFALPVLVSAAVDGALRRKEFA